MNTRSRARRRRPALLGGVLGLALTGSLAAGLGAGTAGAADPAPDCTAPYDDAQLQRDDAVTGLTVSAGTTPEQFTGTVIGTLEDGVAPGIDMIMVRFDSPAIRDAGGIWQGMSGSPVYVGNQLVGAVAYGLAYGPSPIAGVTPYSAMQTWLQNPPAARVPVTQRQAARIASSGDVSARQAADGFRALPIPMSAAGLDAARADQLAGVTRRWNRGVTYAAGRVGTGTADASTLVAGGNVAASAAYGDVTFAGVGTVTSVCDGRVVAFGHPFSNLGATSLGLHPADALYVQPDSLGAPFKVANVGAPVGTIDQDRRTGIAGALGPVPTATAVTSTVSAEGRERTGSTDVYLPQALASAVFSENLANHDRVFDTAGPGTEAQSWTITGDDHGTPFTLQWADTYVDDQDITFGSAFELADITYALSQMEGVTVSAVTVDSDVTTAHTRLRLTGVEQQGGGTWTAVGNRHPAVGRAGRALRLRAVLAVPGSDVPQYQPFTVTVPAGAVREGQVQVVGGEDSWLDSYSWQTVADAQAGLAKALRNDQLGVDTRFAGRGVRSRSHEGLAPLATVVRGQKSFPVVATGR